MKNDPGKAPIVEIVVQSRHENRQAVLLVDQARLSVINRIKNIHHPKEICLAPDNDLPAETEIQRIGLNLALTYPSSVLSSFSYTSRTSSVKFALFLKE